MIASKLHGTAIQLFGDSTSALLTSAVFQPIFVALSNIFGRKDILLAVVVLFLVGSIVGAMSMKFTVLLASRAIMGIGSEGIVALTNIIMTDICLVAERGEWFACISASNAIGCAAGPIISEAVAQGGSWVSGVLCTPSPLMRTSDRWILYLNIPFCGITLIWCPSCSG
jgi:MFS family permease